LGETLHIYLLFVIRWQLRVCKILWSYLPHCASVPSPKSTMRDEASVVDLGRSGN